MSVSVSLPASAGSRGPWTFIRHQAGALLVTALDFTVMTVLVNDLHTSAPLGTAVGAAVGGVTNFWLGRRWIFVNHEGAASGQALRYAFVSGASLLLNTFGEWVLHDRGGVQFQIARLIVAVMVSVAWNFPMHRRFVFRDARTA